MATSSNISVHTVCPETGGIWDVENDGTIHLTLGPKRQKEEDIVTEAHWVEQQWQQLRDRFPDRLWCTAVNLKNVPTTERPPQEVREIYARLVRDEAKQKIAIVHATRAQRAIIDIMLMTAFMPDKVHFFANDQSARDWLKAEHPFAQRVNW